MAEVLGTAASIAAAIQITAKLVSLGCRYESGAGEAFGYTQGLLEELSSVAALLAALQKQGNCTELALSQELGDLFQKLVMEGEELLEKLESDYQSPTRSLRRLKWPLKRGETYRVISRIERHKSLLKLALSMDQISRSRAIMEQTENTITHVQSINTNVQDIKTHIQERITTDDEVRRRTKRSRVLDWICLEDFHKEHVWISSRRQNNIGRWFLNTPEFQGWVGKPGILWGYGIPGAGKTFLTSLVIDHLRGHTGYGVAYIYFDYKEQDRQGPVNVLESLVKQLASQVDVFPNEIISLYDTLKPSGKRLSIEELYSAISALSKSFSKIFIIWDALDECVPEYRWRLFPLLHRMKIDGINIFITSRAYPEDIQHFLADSAKVEIYARSEDIAIYIEQKIDENPRTRRLVMLGKCKDRIISEVAECANGMFLLAHFYIEHLCQQATVRQVLSELEGIKNSSSSDYPLDPTYDRAMRAVQGRPRSCSILAFAALSWVVKARRKLTVYELQEAVSTEEGRTTLDELDLPDRGALLDCASLVVIDGHDTIRLAHYTVQEYLLRRSIVLGDMELEIARTCVAYLSLDIFAQGACLSGSEFSHRLNSHPFLGYAVNYLASHLSQCDEDSTKDLILAFLEKPGSISSYWQVLGVTKATTSSEEYDNLDLGGQAPSQLHVAVSLGHGSLVKLLLEKGADISATDGHGYTPLHCAVTRGFEELVELLLEGGADISATDSRGYTPLHCAAAGGFERPTKVLLGSGADITARGNDGFTALHCAADRGFKGLAQILLENDADISAADSRGYTPLHCAATGGFEKLVKLLLEGGADISATDGRGCTPLHCAAAGGFWELTELLIGEGTDISSQDNAGSTPLHCAASQGHQAVAQLLLAKGAVSSSLDYERATPLHRAAIGGFKQLIVLLLENGANVSAIDDNEDTALDKAAAQQHGSVVRLLLEKGSSFSVLNLNEKTALCLARNLKIFGRHMESLALFSQVLHSQQNRLGRDHPDTLETVQEVSFALGHLGRHGEALELLEQVFVSQEKGLGWEHPDTIGTAQKLVLTLGHLRRYGEMLNYLEQIYVAEKNKLGEENPDTLTTAHKIAQALGHLGRYQEMHDLAKKVLPSREKILGKKSVDTLNTASNVAWALDRLGRYEEALDLYGEVRSSRTEVLGNHHPDTLMTTYNMALALENLGRYEAMLQLLEQVLVSQEEIFGKEHQDTLTTTHQKSQALGHLGRHEEALELYQEVFASRKKILGDEHPDTLKTSHNMAQTFNYLKKYELALALYEQILASRRVVLGGEHPDTLDTAHNLAHTLTNLSRYKESVELYARVLATREKALGQEHPSSLETAHNMAQALSHLGRYQEALSLYTSVVSSRKKVLGTEHSDTLGTIYEMAWAFYCIGTYEKALVLYQQVLSSRETILGKEHPDTMETASKVAQTLSRLRRYEEALELYEGVFPNQDEALEDPATLAIAHNIAKILAHFGRHADAADLYEKALSGRRGVLGSEDLDTLETCQDMAYTLGCLGRYVEPLGLYEEVLASQENRLREGHPDILRTIKCMASIHEKAGWRKEAQLLYKEVLIGQKRELGEKHPDTLDTIRRLAIVVDHLGCDNETIIKTSSETAAALEDLRRLGKASEFCPPAITQNTAATAARSDPQILRNEDFRSLQQSLVTEDKRPGKESFGVLKLIGETIPSPEELGRQSEVSDPDERTLHSINKLPGNKDQSISGITSFLKRHARRLEETTWRVKYKISSLEFSIIRELESSRINRELPIRVQWKCTCGESLFDDFQELSGGSPAARCVSRLYRGSSNVEIDGSEPILGLPDFFSFPTSMFLGAHYPLNLSILIQIFLGGSGLLGFPISLVRIAWRDIGLVGFLNRLGVVSHPSYPTQGGASSQSPPSPAQPIQMASNSQQPSQGTANNPYLPPQVGQSHQVRNRSSPAQVTPTPSSTDHLFLCFNDEFVHFRNLQLAPNISDQEIFMAIREEYYRRRGWWRSQFSFEVLKRVDFVKFEIYYQNRVEIRVRGDLPPVDNKEYKYLPKPAEMIPPVPGFMYFFHKPECATPNSDELLTRMPKKICALRGRGYGWGIHFIEEPCMFRVYMLAVFIVIIDSVFAVVWSVVKKDIQGGFGIAAFITSVGAIFIAIGWRQTENGKGY